MKNLLMLGCLGIVLLSAAAQEEPRVSLRAANQPLSAVLAEVAKQSKIDIQLLSDEDPAVSVTIANATVDVAVKAVCEKVGYRYRQEGHSLVVYSANLAAGQGEEEAPARRQTVITGLGTQLVVVQGDIVVVRLDGSDVAQAVLVGSPSGERRQQGKRVYDFRFDTTDWPTRRVHLEALQTTYTGRKLPPKAVEVVVVKEAPAIVASPPEGSELTGKASAGIEVKQTFTAAKAAINLDDLVVADIKAAPWVAEFDARKCPPGNHLLWATLTDMEGRFYCTPPVEVTIPEKVWFESPKDGTEIQVGNKSETLLVTLGFDGLLNPQRIKLFLNHYEELKPNVRPAAVLTGAPWKAEWEVGKTLSGTHFLVAEAVDKAGDVWRSRLLSVYVTNPFVKPARTQQTRPSGREGGSVGQTGAWSGAGPSPPFLLPYGAPYRAGGYGQYGRGATPNRLGSPYGIRTGNPWLAVFGAG